MRSETTARDTIVRQAIVLFALLVAGPAAGDPILTIQATPLGGGLVAHDVSVDFQDGLGRSGFVEITFSGSFVSPQTQLLGGSWPDLQQIDAGQTTSTVYHLRGGSGAGSSVDVVPVAQLVLASGQPFSYDGVVSRDGQNFTVVPEPAAALGVAALLSVVALATRRRLQC